MAIPEAKQYIKDFEKLGFGIFIHFGLYSMLGRGEWIGRMGEDIKEESYKELIKSFNPGSMENIVVAAKAAGAKYITFTTKHHDGFCLYDTCGLTDFDSVHALAGRDLVREFTDACRKHDIVPVFYHATFEFWHKDFDDNFDAYLEYLRKNVEILCTKYGKIGGLWFDGNWSKKGEGDVWHEDELYATIRKYQPDAMIINNTGLGKQGATGHPEIDSVTFERGMAHPLNREGMSKYVTGEMCDSVNMHWGIADDLNYKSPKVLIEALCNCRKVGANYLLNVGPDADGEVPTYPKALIEIIGKWLEKFGEAVYGAEPFWSAEGQKNFALKKGDNVYFFCYDITRKGSKDVVYLSGNEGDYTFENFPEEVKNIKWMDNDEELISSYENGDLTINLTGYSYGHDYCVRVAKGTLK